MSEWGERLRLGARLLGRNLASAEGFGRRMGFAVGKGKSTAVYGI